MRNIEIGSEFQASLLEHGNGLSISDRPGGCFVFSGRTAIETVINNIMQERQLNSAVLPSYCCESMVQPFIDKNVEVSFYDVFYSDGLQINLPDTVNADALIWCNYFGFRNTMPDLSNFSNNGGIIIEDITHSLLSDKPFHDQSDYVVASIRKWEPILCGGYCEKKNGILTLVPDNQPPYYYLDLKKTAMMHKSIYLQDENNDKLKNEYLHMFSMSNKWLGEHYHNLAIDEESKLYIQTADISSQQIIRRRNAESLYNLMGEMNNFTFLFPLEDLDCPLFVPIIVRNEMRRKIRELLIDNKIYCPIHWPRHGNCESNLYDMELSLVCDQRYTESDMKRIVDILEYCDKNL